MSEFKIIKEFKNVKEINCTDSIKPKEKPFKEGLCVIYPRDPFKDTETIKAHKISLENILLRKEEIIHDDLSNLMEVSFNKNMVINCVLKSRDVWNDKYTVLLCSREKTLQEFMEEFGG